MVYDSNEVNLDEFNNFNELLTNKQHNLDVTIWDVNNKINNHDDNNTTKSIDSIKYSILKTDGTNDFDHLIFLPIRSKQLVKEKVNAKALIKFFNNGGNILTITSPKQVSDPIRIYLNELGIYPSPRDQFLKDNFVDSDEEKNSNLNNQLYVLSKQLINKYVYTLDSNNDNDKIFNFGQSSIAILDNREQIVPILRSSKTSFIDSINSNKKQLSKKDIWSQGSQSYLTVGFQGLNNARTIWIGSLDFFNDLNFIQNESFINELINWNFNEKSVVKLNSVNHSHVSGESYDTKPYKINDLIDYNISLSQWINGNWEPFFSNDIQFELRQVDPYYRITMEQINEDIGSANTNSTEYTTGPFKLPNRHGMFKFNLDYKRSGLSFVEHNDVKAIRHIANDEYSRSFEITNSWIYLASIFVVILSFVSFVVIFLTTSSNIDKVIKEKKEN